MSHKHTDRAQQSKSPREEGVALIIVLLVMTITTVLIVQLSYSTKIDLRIAKNNRDKDKIYYALRAAALKAQAYLRYDAGTQTGAATDSKSDEWASGQLSDSYGDVSVKVEIEDEARRFNLMHLVKLGDKAKQKEFHKQSIATLEAILLDFRAGTRYEIGGMEASTIVRQIGEWLTRNNRHQVTPPPTESGNKALTIDELLLIGSESITPHLLYDQWDEDDEILIPGLYRYITLWSKGKVNINTADFVVLRALFKDRNKGEAEKIIEYRGDPDEDDILDTDEINRDERLQEEDDLEGSGLFEKTTDLTENNVIDTDAFNEIQNLIDVKSSVFSVYITAKLERIEKRIRIVFRRENQKIYTILWEERPDLRIPPEGPDYDDEDPNGFGGLFGP